MFMCLCVKYGFKRKEKELLSSIKFDFYKQFCFFLQRDEGLLLFLLGETAPKISSIQICVFKKVLRNVNQILLFIPFFFVQHLQNVPIIFGFFFCCGLFRTKGFKNIELILVLRRFKLMQAIQKIDVLAIETGSVLHFTFPLERR